MSDTDHAAAIRKAIGLILTLDRTSRTICRRVVKHADALQQELKDAHRKIELLEWMAYQRRQRPDWSDDEILRRVTYLPEWRELEGEAQS